MHFRIAESINILDQSHTYSLQVELVQGGKPTWFTIAKNRNFNALLALAGDNKLAYEIVRA